MQAWEHWPPRSSSAWFDVPIFGLSVTGVTLTVSHWSIGSLRGLSLCRYMCGFAFQVLATNSVGEQDNIQCGRAAVGIGNVELVQSHGEGLCLNLEVLHSQSGAVRKS